MNHKDLVIVGAKWVKHSHNGCEFPDGGYRMSHPIVLKELVSYEEAIPDVIGFCAGYSTVIECKATRRDYLADKKKPHRYNVKQPGNYRYYLTPTNALNDDIYNGWGLLETDGVNVVVRVTAPFHFEPEVKVAEYSILYSFARRKLGRLIKYTEEGKE